MTDPLGAQLPSHQVICQKWEESERGWGTRPDSHSLHLTDHDRQRFIKEYWETMPDDPPDEYSRPHGTPYACIVDDATCEAIRASAAGIWRHGSPPGSTGPDGWVNPRLQPKDR